MTTQLNDLIDQITPHLRARLRVLANPSDSIFDDLLQHAIIKIFEKSILDPAFAEQKDAYIVQYGFWMAKHQIESECVYGKYVESLGDTTVEATDDDDITMFEVIPAEDPDPAVEAMRRETLAELVEAVRSLSPESRILVKMLYAGYNEREIASALHVSYQAVNCRKQSIAKMLHQRQIAL